MHTSSTDEQLIKQIQDGDILAFESIVKRYQKKLFSFARRLIHDEDAATDVVQDSLINVYKSIDRVDTSKKFSTYIYAITKNNAISFLRKNKKEVQLSEEIVGHTDQSFYDDLQRDYEKETISTALASLAPTQKKVIELYYFSDLSYDEISKQLKLPINTVRTHLRRGKEKLKILLSPKKKIY